MIDEVSLSTKRCSELGVLSIHLDASPCSRGCPFCYLGRRVPGRDAATTFTPALLAAVLGALEYDEAAVAVNRDDEASERAVELAAHCAHARGRRLALTTTPDVVLARPRIADTADRLTLSVDPLKWPFARPGKGAREGDVSMAELIAWLPTLARAGRELTLVVTLSDAAFAEAMFAHGLGRLLAVPSVDQVAVHGLKPPPPWSNGRLWLAACAQAGALLKRHLGNRLFFDCAVAVHLFGLGDCPGRPDVSPGREFRSCVYQEAPDFVFSDAVELSERLRGWHPPARCPFALEE